MPRPLAAAPGRARLIAGLAASVLLGALTTLALAWIPAYRGIRVPNTLVPAPTAMKSRDNFALVFWPSLDGAFWTQTYTSCDLVVNESDRTIEFPRGHAFVLTSASTVEHIPSGRHPDLQPFSETFEFRFGWPLRAFWGTHIRNMSAFAFRNECVHELPRGTNRSPDMPFVRNFGSFPFTRALPTGILPLGLTLDILILAAAWFLLLAAPRFVRRAARRRRSLCLACAYPLTGLPPSSPCPECGRSSPFGSKEAGA